MLIDSLNKKVCFLDWMITVMIKQREICFVCVCERGFVFLRSRVSKAVSDHVRVCVCVWLCSPRHACVREQCPGLDWGGLSEISCKRITDHASLAYWFTAKNTYIHTKSSSLQFLFFYLCLSLSHSDTHSHPHKALVHTLHLRQWVHLAFKECEGYLFIRIAKVGN